MKETHLQLRKALLNDFKKAGRVVILSDEENMDPLRNRQNSRNLCFREVDESLFTLTTTKHPELVISLGFVASDGKVIPLIRFLVGLSPYYYEYGYECDQLNPFRWKLFLVDKTSNEPKPISIGSKVWIQDPTSKIWDRTATVQGKKKDREYLLLLPSGRTLCRNRRFIRILRTREDIITTPQCESTLKDNSQTDEPSNPQRPKRLKFAPIKFTPSDRLRARKGM
ncbi:unnamed protein product [Lepeophtheirus salmonis]|uniref:(salmon louse) hypothetical protein n=1 Tax=Lepeophtheirus salmonis TaxID=72036 RepID=A0A7R8CDP3_LEPSM|nr:unnamed protein product [Lepeophtheirus salmonis]CAF2781931.1 unnamed protein product [Lepeophtheirus salmonis]